MFIQLTVYKQDILGLGKKRLQNTCFSFPTLIHCDFPLGRRLIRNWISLYFLQKGLVTSSFATLEVWENFLNHQAKGSKQDGAFIFLNLFIFNWREIALQYWFGFCHTSKSISPRYIYIYMSPPAKISLPPPILSHPSRLLQSPS